MAPTKFFTIATLLLAALIEPTAGEPYLVVGRSSQDVSPRDDIVQGWALVENLCPDGLGACGKRACCPIGSYCDDNEATNSNLCCPTRTGCAYDVSKADRCAVSTWVEWYTINDPICCLPGEIGVQPGPHDYYGFCSSAGSNVPSSLLASSVRSPSTAAATSQASSSPAASASTHSTPTTAATTPSTSAAAPATTSAPAPVPTTSAGSANSIATSATKATSSAAGAATSTAAANVNTPVQGGLGSLLGMVGVIVGFLAV